MKQAPCKAHVRSHVVPAENGKKNLFIKAFSFNMPNGIYFAKMANETFNLSLSFLFRVSFTLTSFCFVLVCFIFLISIFAVLGSLLQPLGIPLPWFCFFFLFFFFFFLSSGIWTMPGISPACSTSPRMHTERHKHF